MLELAGDKSVKLASGDGLYNLLASRLQDEVTRSQVLIVSMKHRPKEVCVLRLVLAIKVGVVGSQELLYW